MTIANRAAWVFVAVSIVYITFIGGVHSGTHLPELRLVSVVLTGAAAGTWLLVAARDPLWRPRSALLPGFVAVLAAFVISTIASRSPRISAEYLAYAVMLAALYLLLVRLMALPEVRTRVVALAGLIGLAVIGQYLLAVGLDWARLWAIVGHVFTPPLRPSFESLVFGNPAVVVVVAVLFGSVAIGWEAGWRRFRTPAIAITSVAGAIAVVASGTRGAWLAIGLAAAAVLVVAAVRAETRAGVVRSLRRLGITKRWRLVVPAAVVVGLVALVLAPGLIQRIATGGETNRPAFYRMSVQMFTEAPATGVGPGMWAAQRIAYTATSELDEWVPHAHDIYLQAAAELGVVGLAAGALAATLIVWLLRDALRDQDPVRRRWGWIAIFTTVYFATHQLVDFYSDLPVAQLGFAIPIAVLDATATRRPSWVPSRSLALDGRAARLAVAVLGIALAGAALTELPALRHASAVALANEGRWVEAYEPAIQAADLDPAMPIYQLTAGLAAAHAGNYADAAGRFRQLADATDLPEAWLNLADASWQLGDEFEARSALERSLRLGIQRAAVTVPAAELAMRLGDDDTAVRALSRAVVQVPSIAGDPWWGENAQRRAVLSAAMHEAIGGGNPALEWQLALMSGDATTATARAEALPSLDAEPALLVIASWNGDHAAAGHVVRICRERPTSAWVSWCVRVAAHLGMSDVEDLRDWARITGSTDSSMTEMRIETRPGVFAVTSDSAYLYGFQTYRRLVAWDILSPTLLHLIQV